MKNNTLNINNTEINFDVLNALNLHHPYLGEAYSNFGWNPLGGDFSLDIPFIEKYLEGAKHPEEAKAPAFLEKEPKKVFDAFKTASKNNKDMISTLKQRLQKGEFADFKGADISPQVKDILFFLECRQQMLDTSIKQLATNKLGALKAYKNINSINKKLSQLLEEAYSREFSKSAALGNMLLQAQLNHQNAQGKTQPQLSSNLVSLLGKTFSANQVFVADGQKTQAIGKTFVESLVENLTDFTSATAEIAKGITEAQKAGFLETSQPQQQQVFENSFTLTPTQAATPTKAPAKAPERAAVRSQSNRQTPTMDK